MTIPQHILDRAAEIHERIIADGPESAIHHIAEAIVEENKACSQVAADRVRSSVAHMRDDGGAYWQGSASSAQIVEGTILYRMFKEG